MTDLVCNIKVKQIKYGIWNKKAIDIECIELCSWEKKLNVSFIWLVGMGSSAFQVLQIRRAENYDMHKHDELSVYVR